MAETYRGARLFREAINEHINTNIDYKEGIGYFDFGEIREDGSLITGTFGKDSPIPKEAYQICLNLLGGDCETDSEYEVTVKKRLETGTGYLVCYVNSIPVVVDKTVNAKEVM